MGYVGTSAGHQPSRLRQPTLFDYSQLPVVKSSRLSQFYRIVAAGITSSHIDEPVVASCCHDGHARVHGHAGHWRLLSLSVKNSLPRESNIPQPQVTASARTQHLRAAARLVGASSAITGSSTGTGGVVSLCMAVVVLP